MISGGKLSSVLLLKKTSLFSSGNTRWIECGSSLSWLVDASGLEVTLGVALFFPFRDNEDNMDDVLPCFLGYYWDRFPSIVLLDLLGLISVNNRYGTCTGILCRSIECSRHAFFLLGEQTGFQV